MERFVELAERVLKLAWRWHFHTPKIVYWFTFAMGVAGISLWREVGGAELLFAAALMVVHGAQGVIRWAHYQSRPPALAIPFFETTSPELSAEVRRVITTSIRDHLTAPFDEAVRPIDVVVGPSDKSFAHRLRRRLGALYLVYGEVRDGDPHSVFSRLSVEPPSEVMHQDWVTMDITPQRTIWDALFHKLSPSYGARDVEYPFRSADELRGLVASLEAEIWMLARQPAKAEEAFRLALVGLETSESHAVDEVRVRLSHAVRQQGRDQDALAVLKARASAASASPELLRQFSALLMQLSDVTNPYIAPIKGSRGDVTAALRRAASHTSDPLRDQSLYNLAMALGDAPSERSEKEAILERLFVSKSHYRRAWYVKRERGLIHWKNGEALRASGETDAAKREFKLAARWDTRTLRARPKLRIRRRPYRIRFGGRVVWVLQVPWPKHYRIPPILWGAAAEAHEAAGNRQLARYYDFRHRRRVDRLMKLGEAGVAQQNWDAAYANFDWASTGKATVHSCLALVGRAVALQQLGQSKLASESLARARAMYPDGNQVASVALQHFSRYQLPLSLPQ